MNTAVLSFFGKGILLHRSISEEESTARFHCSLFACSMTLANRDTTFYRSQSLHSIFTHICPLHGLYVGIYYLHGLCGNQSHVLLHPPVELAMPPLWFASHGSFPPQDALNSSSKTTHDLSQDPMKASIPRAASMGLKSSTKAGER